MIFDNSWLNTISETAKLMIMIRTSLQDTRFVIFDFNLLSYGISLRALTWLHYYMPKLLKSWNNPGQSFRDPPQHLVAANLWVSEICMKKFEKVLDEKIFQKRRIPRDWFRDYPKDFKTEIRNFIGKLIFKKNINLLMSGLDLTIVVAY